MKSKGVQVIELTEDEKRQFQEATKSTEALIRKELGDALVDEFMAAVDEAKKTIK